MATSPMPEITVKRNEGTVLVGLQSKKDGRVLALDQEERRLAILAIERRLQLAGRAERAAVNLHDHVALLQAAFGGDAGGIELDDGEPFVARFDGHPVLAALAAFNRRRRGATLRQCQLANRRLQR